MVNSHVLVLNKSFLPIHITTVKRAFCLLYGGVAKAVNSQYETFDFESWSQITAERNDDTIGLVNRVIKVPRVILLNAGFDSAGTISSPGIGTPASIADRDFLGANSTWITSFPGPGGGRPRGRTWFAAAMNAIAKKGGEPRARPT